jgi:hypothetical protein
MRLTHRKQRLTAQVAQLVAAAQLVAVAQMVAAAQLLTLALRVVDSLLPSSLLLLTLPQYEQADFLLGQHKITLTNFNRVR